MSEEENVSVEEQSSEAVAQAPETESVQEERKETAQERKQRNDAEYNWAETRRKMQEQERRIQEQSEMIQKLQPQKTEDDDLERLADDDIVTKGQVKKLATKMAREIAQEIIRQREAATVDERLANKFTDYSEIVTKENIELLKQNEPELALSLAHNPDPYAQGVAVYKILKRINGDQVPMKNVEKKKALENSQKPVSVNAATKTSAIGNAHLFENGLTPELKAQLWKEMQQASKGY
jgi:hypothetical protein